MDGLVHDDMYLVYIMVSKMIIGLNPKGISRLHLSDY
jgi:hypothetical protein